MYWWRRSKVLSPRSRMMISFCPIINDTIKRFALFINNRAKYWEIVEAKFILRIVVWVSTVTTDVYSISVYTYTHTTAAAQFGSARRAVAAASKDMKWFFFSYCYHQRRPTCSTLANFLSFAQISLTRKKMSSLTLSLPFLKCECTPDHQSSKKSALFFQSFFLSNFQWFYEF